MRAQIIKYLLCLCAEFLGVVGVGEEHGNSIFLFFCKQSVITSVCAAKTVHVFYFVFEQKRVHSITKAFLCISC